MRLSKKSKIYIAGHNGMVGSAIVRKLNSLGYQNLIVETSKNLDLRNSLETESFFKLKKPEFVFLAAAKVGGILANSTYKADFIYDNLMIQSNVIKNAHKYDVKKLLFLGSWVTENNDWEGWILYMLEMVEYTANKGLERLKNVTSLMDQMATEIKETNPKVYTKELVEILFRLPYTKRQFLIDAKLGTPKTVGNYLMKLEKSGFLISEKVGKEKLYLNHKLMAILEIP